MLTKNVNHPKARIYLVGIYLFKVNNKQFRAMFVNCSKINKKDNNLSNLTDLGTLRNITLVSSLLTLKRFHTFSQHFTVNLGSTASVGLSVEIKVQTCKNYATCKDTYKSYHISQTDKTTTWNETCIEFKNYAKCRMNSLSEENPK